MTIISHFYNEEYLLPWWLEHHRKYFNHGIMINYGSTDKSVEIIRDICPSWDILESRNGMFDAKLVDDEIMDIEKTLIGPRICLNTTEFLIGDFSKLNSTINIPGLIMVDSEDQMFTNPTDLLSERRFGIPYEIDAFRGCRCLHYGEIRYAEPGRHFRNITTDNFLILWYGFSPFNEQQILRKLQIQNKIPTSDIQINRGKQHIVCRDDLLITIKDYQKKAIDLSNTINKIWKL